tara:strand:- start:141 stop:848 length:708 start_codon:yes stop_codon:yes gene_type:complete
MSSIKLKHSGGNSVSLNPPSSAPTASDVAFKLPNADGSANQVIKTDGSGNLSFTTVADTNDNTWVKLSKTTITSNTSQVDFTNSITGAFDTYKTYVVTVTGLVPQNDDYTLRARKFDSNGIYSGSEQQTRVVENGTGYSYAGESSFVLIRQGIGNNSSGSEVYENFNGIFYFFNFAANNRFSVMSSCVYKNASSDAIFTTMGGTTNVTTATTGIRFYMSSGDISTGEFTLYGIAT